MECPVCYTQEAECNLVCGHSFCYQCMNNWYQKFEKHNCPLCRQSIRFLVDDDVRILRIECSSKASIDDYVTFKELLDKYAHLDVKDLEYLRRQKWVDNVMEYRGKNPEYTKDIFYGLQGTQETCHQKRQKEPQANLFTKTYKE